MSDERLKDVRVREFSPDMPGVWVDGNGALHFSIPEIHAAFGIPNTPEGIEETRRIMNGLLVRMLPPGTEIVNRDEPGNHSATG